MLLKTHEGTNIYRKYYFLELADIKNCVILHMQYVEFKSGLRYFRILLPLFHSFAFPNISSYGIGISRALCERYLAGDFKPIGVLSSTGGAAHLLYTAYDT